MSCWETSAKTSSPYYSHSEIVRNIPLEVFLFHCEIVNEQDVHKEIVLLLDISFCSLLFIVKVIPVRNVY